MVATRRGVRVTHPAKTSPDPPSDVPATPAFRRTRQTAQEVDNAAQSAPEETSRQTDANSEREAPGSPAPSIKRCTRASRLHSPEQPCTPVGSTHEADVSDLESCCSALSDLELPVTRSRGRKKQPRAASREDEEISEVESVSSAVSASKVGQINRRSTRRRAAPEVPDPAGDGTDVKVDQMLEPESCCSVVSESKRVTRSQRKTRTRSSAKQQKEDSEVSDADSCMSFVSGAKESRSTTRRATRSRKQTCPILINLDESSECSRSPAGRQTRATRAKTTASVEGSGPPSCDSEGFESGPTYSITTRRRGQSKSTAPKTVDSDSELTDVHSPMSSPTRSRGTPCSSRTGSWNSSRGAPGPRSSTKDISIVLEKVGEPSEEDSSLNESRLESTVIADDADCTLLEEHQSSAIEEKEDMNTADIATNDAATESVKKEVVSESAVMAKDQQEEQSVQNKDENTSEMEKMQEMIHSSEPLKASQSVTVTIWEKASEITEEKGKDMEVADLDTHPPREEQAVDEDAVMETQPNVEEGMEVSSLNTDAKEVVDAGKSIQVTSYKQNWITVDSESEQQPKDVIVRNKKVISLLESSDEEDEYDEEGERVSGDEEEEERGGPSKKSEEATTSVEGLFMIDTRPGQEADGQYYTERPAEQAKSKEAGLDDDEFVDEEGDDDDDDDDAKMLFWSRNPQLKEMSSRIDPGIRVKELGGLYINFDGSKSKPVSSSLQKLKDKKIQDEVMKKSVIGPDFEKKEAVPPYSESKQALKLKRREERKKSTGDGWFNMKAPELSQELKGDLQVLKMRGSMDSKRFYKKNDRDGFPKYFQIGTVVDNPVDFYHSRIPKKERKRTMVEELLADAEFRHKNKKKYQQIITEKAAQGAGKRNKKKNKFHKK